MQLILDARAPGGLPIDRGNPPRWSAECDSNSEVMTTDMRRVIGDQAPVQAAAPVADYCAP